MMRYLFLFILGLFVFDVAFAQKDTAVYYLKNSGKVVSTKDSADFFLVILPPDTSFDKKLFIVKEFYTNGKLKLIGGSISNSLESLKFQGSYVVFYPNGHKMLVRNYEKGEPIGDEIQYYPNGKLYLVRSHGNKGKVFLKQFNDSTGNVLAENGKGKWKEYNENFSAIKGEGGIDNGVEDGTWRGKVNDSVNFESVFNKGKLISTFKTYKNKPIADAYSKVDVAPEFPGGFTAFDIFLKKNVRPPAIAREDGIQGKVIISYVVEKEGNITNIKVVRGIGGGCEEEAIRVIISSPPWKPGMLDGKVVRTISSVSINFFFQGNKEWITVDPQ
jgi:antitoxin component YwqK of YwqJK toxin-antitoxin module